MGQSASWCGSWQREGQEEVHKLRADSDRLTLEFHSKEIHGLLCGDLGEEWQAAPAQASCLVAVSGGGLAAPLMWRHYWHGNGLRSEISSKADILRIDRHLVDGNLLIKVELQKSEDVTELMSFSCRPLDASGPLPVSFLRAHGLPLKSLEERYYALDQVEALLSEHELLSAAQLEDRVVPASWAGSAQWLRGGIAYYKSILPEWMTPEPLSDLNPSVLKAGVEAEYVVHKEAKGVCINIVPWNAPATLAFAPTLSMLAAGNHVVVKPADLTPTVAAVLRRLCQKYLSGYVWVEEGGKEAVERLIDEGADHLEFTGGGEVAKVVAARCAQTLTPVTLELGGKSPCYVDHGLGSEMLRSVVTEIFETKVFKTGQFCCAHDYALIHESLFGQFCNIFEDMVNSLGTRRHVKLIGRKQYDSMKFLLHDAASICIPTLEGDFKPKDEEMSVPMTGLVSPALDREVLRSEIFGPIIPLLAVTGVEEAIGIINRIGPKPLIAYCYTKDEVCETAFVSQVPAGNIAVNGGPQRMIGNYAVTFGGIGPSGTGAGFWGTDGLREFSNRKHVMSAKKGFARSFFSGPPT